MRRLAFALLALAVWATAAAAAATTPPWLEAAAAGDYGKRGGSEQAVRLLDSGIVHYTSPEQVHAVYRGAIRPLTNNGRARCECHYVFDRNLQRIVNASAWVVREGRLVAAFTTRDFVDVAAHRGDVNWNHVRVLTLNVSKLAQTGDTFGWEFEVQSEAGVIDVGWALDESLSTRTAEFSVFAAPGITLRWRSSHKDVEPAPTLDGNGLSWRWENVKRADAAIAPPGFVAQPRVLSVRAVATSSGEDLSWPSLARRLSAEVEPRLHADPSVAAKSASLVAGKPSAWDRLNALCRFVQTETTYVAIASDSDSLAGYRPHAPGEVLANRFGDCKDKAALLIALARAAGIDAVPIAVATAHSKFVDPEWPALRFDHMIVGFRDSVGGPPTALRVNLPGIGPVILCDPTVPWLPPGFLPNSDQGAVALAIDGKSEGLCTLPVDKADSNRRDVRTRITLGTHDAAARFDVSETHRGQAAFALRTAAGRLDRQAIERGIQERLHATFPLLSDFGAEPMHLEDDDEARVAYHFAVPRYGERTADGVLLLAPTALGTVSRMLPEWSDKARGAVWFPARSVHSQVLLKLPKGTRADDLPGNFEEAVGKATARVHYKRDGNSVQVDIELKEMAGFVDHAGYAARRELLAHLAQAERRPIPVRPAAAP